MQLDKAMEALHPGDTLVVTRLDRLDSSIVNMLNRRTISRQRVQGYLSLT